jgi:hypothetical protein
MRKSHRLIPVLSHEDVRYPGRQSVSIEVLFGTRFVPAVIECIGEISFLMEKQGDEAAMLRRKHRCRLAHYKAELRRTCNRWAYCSPVIDMRIESPNGGLIMRRSGISRLVGHAAIGQWMLHSFPIAILPSHTIFKKSDHVMPSGSITPIYTPLSMAKVYGWDPQLLPKIDEVYYRLMGLPSPASETVSVA